MKTSFILIVISILLFCCNTSTTAQNNAIKKDSVKQYMGVSDSLGYMTEIAANKQKYINQPLSILLNDLKIPIKSYSTSTGTMHRNDVYTLDVSFDDSHTTIMKETKGFQYTVGVHIKWAAPLSLNEIEANVQNTSGEWTEVEQRYYNNKIIGDISTWSTSEQ